MILERSEMGLLHQGFHNVAVYKQVGTTKPSTMKCYVGNGWYLVRVFTPGRRMWEYITKDKARANECVHSRLHGGYAAWKKV